MNAFSFDFLNELPIIGILRGFPLDQLDNLLAAAASGGLRNIEITMNSPRAIEQIRSALELASGKLNIGAGTVTDLHLLDEAVAAGASFIVTPTLNPEVLQRCVAEKIPVFPGAFTPTEVVQAWDLGATMVKIFPAETVGPAYIKSLKAPLPDVKLLPTGGVDLETLADYVKAGADGFGIGSPLFNKQRIEDGDWAWIEAQCRAFAAQLKRRK